MTPIYCLLLLWALCLAAVGIGSLLYWMGKL